MPDVTPRLGLKKPLGNETVSRTAYNENLDILDEVVAKEEDLAAHLADYVKQVGYASATGSANTYSITLNPAPSSLVEGLCVAVKINVDNTGPSTLNVNNLGAKPIKKSNGNDVSAGNLKAGSIYTLRYNGVNFILQGEGGGGTAQPGDVLSGKTFTNDVGEQVGTMPNQGAMIITPGTSNQTIPVGYHNGSGYVKGDANLIAKNIKSGVSIFDVSGSWAVGLPPYVNGKESLLFVPGYNSGGTLTKETADLYAACGPGISSAIFVSDEMVNFTNIDNIRFNFDYTCNVRNSGVSYVLWISTSKMTNFSYGEALAYKVVNRGIQTALAVEELLNVSSVTGLAYIKFGVQITTSNTSYQIEIKMKRIYLE